MPKFTEPAYFLLDHYLDTVNQQSTDDIKSRVETLWPVIFTDVDLIAEYWSDQILWLRQHPSIFVWMMGSDKLPIPELEQKYIDLFKKYDTSRPYVTSAGGVGSDQNVIGDAFRGATWVSIHNGGGVGWGEVINGGFGMVLDGTDEADKRLHKMLYWDVNNGIARRSWAKNEGAVFTAKRAMKIEPKLKITIPNIADDELINGLFE